MDFEHLYEVVRKAINDAGDMRFVYLDQKTSNDILTILGNCRDGLAPDYKGVTDIEQECKPCRIDLEPEGDDHVRQQ